MSVPAAERCGSKGNLGSLNDLKCMAAIMQSTGVFICVIEKDISFDRVGNTEERSWCYGFSGRGRETILNVKIYNKNDC